MAFKIQGMLKKRLRVQENGKGLYLLKTEVNETGIFVRSS